MSVDPPVGSQGQKNVNRNRKTSKLCKEVFWIQTRSKASIDLYACICAADCLHVDMGRLAYLRIDVVS